MTTLEPLDGWLVERAFRDRLWNGQEIVEVRVAGDGNCLFRAISLALKGTEDEWMYYRRKAAAWMDRNTGKELTDGEDPSAILRGEWGGPLSVDALARCFGMRVVVFGMLAGGTKIGYTAGYRRDPELILFFRGCHFNLGVCREDYEEYFRKPSRKSQESSTTPRYI